VGIVHEGRLVEAVQPAELAADADLLSVFVDRVEGDPGASPSRA
jgi:hypothetical protein